MSAALHRWPLRVFAALLLAVLCAQALPHQPISLDRGRGPVFSAATAEVTLPPREGEAGLVCTVAAPCPDERPAATTQLALVGDRHTCPESHRAPAGARFPFRQDISHDNS